MSKNQRKEEAIYKVLFAEGLSRGDLKKVEIIKMVIMLIASKGIEQTSFENVGRPLGMTKANVAYYFLNKEEMIQYAIKYITVTAQQITVSEIEKATTHKERIEAYVKGTFRWAKEYPEQIP